VQSYYIYTSGIIKLLNFLTNDIEIYDYGKFIHILDLEGNRVELWEAID
jgi:hypothetical protein